MKTTTNSTHRFGITKSRAGHYTVWCAGAPRTLNLISSAHRASEALAAAKKAVGGAIGIEARALFLAWLDAHQSEY